jgi:hypothetical protein
MVQVLTGMIFEISFQSIKISKALVKDSRDLSCIKQIMARESLDSIRITGAKGTIIR